jgi:energy-converting hydrogenase A subunit L
MDNQVIYLIYILSFVIGSIVGLVLSYKKYTEPFVRKNIDVLALILAIIGWMLALNNPLLSLVPYYITVPIGVFLIAMVIGMRPGYGRYETVIGFALAGIVWILRMVLS